METYISWKWIALCAFSLMIVLSVASSSYHYAKPLPENVSYESKVYFVDEGDIKFLFDFTYHEINVTSYEHEIFDEVFAMIEDAEDFILLDMFLFNNDYSHLSFKQNLTTDLTAALLEKKNTHPDIDIVFITDNLNTFYGSYYPSHFEALENAGVTVVFTDMHQLRDSNPLYSGFWRMFIQPFGNSESGWIKHPLGNVDEKVTIRGLLNVLNAKANHRKLIVTQSNKSSSALITSANPHTASSDHSNIAIKVNNSISQDILHGEQAVIDFSNKDIDLDIKQTQESNGDIQIQYVTEKKIKNSMLKDIKDTKEGDDIYVYMFYLSDRQLITALKEANARGVNLYFVLDPNKDAFGREKNGIPNRQVAYEFAKDTNATILWYNTQGEQFHTKAIFIIKDDKTIVHLGSSNLTKRNLHDYNLEANVKVILPNNSTHTTHIKNYVNQILENENATYTLPYDSFKDESFIKYWLYRFQEFTGLSTF